MTTLSFVQPTFYSCARELSLAGIVSIVNRNVISIETRCPTGVRFFLLDVVQTISSREAFQLGTKGKNWNVYKVLIITFTHICTLFKSWVVPHNNRSNFSTDAEIDYVPSRLVQVIINLVFSTIRKPCFLFCQTLDTLLVFMMNQFGTSLIKPLVFRLKPKSINNKRLISRADYCCKIIQSQINRYSIQSRLH